MFLRIAIPSPLYRLFDYLAPPNCDPCILPAGVRIAVPFGRQERVGFLVEQSAESHCDPSQLRHALRILDAEPLLPPDVLALILWAQRYYHHPPGEVFSSALPTLLRAGQAALLAPTPAPPCWRVTEAGRAALAATQLRRAPSQWRVLDYLAQCSDGVELEALRPLVKQGAAVLRTLQAKNWVEPILARQPSVTPVAALPLNAPQAQAVAAIVGAFQRFQVFLLDGVTGSGKTEVYLQAIAATVAQGRQALVLTPEIGLTPQLVARFRERLSGTLAISHSGLSDKERLKAWLMMRNGQAQVMVGTRSAVFTPMQAPGLLIIDEEHDSSFKQQDGFRYQARDLAIVRAQQLGIPIVLGSATPALESWHNAQSGRYQLLSLPERAGGGTVPQIQIIDVRRKPLTAGLAAPLLERMRTHLQRGEQVLLFLNRRGFAPLLRCHECGWMSLCQHCDARMTVHLRRQRLVCHHCGVQRAVESICPECGNTDLQRIGQGTERLESALQEQFPEVGLIRMDRDSTRHRGSLEALLAEIHQGDPLLLVGTQMLAKGHHFPNVTLVGIVDMDHGLYGLDFRASERMAQLILQVAGRAGRAEKPGTVLIQTHHPEHVLLRTLVGHGYAAFAEQALRERQAALLPPFAYQALLRAEAVDPELASAFLHAARSLGEPFGDYVEMLGPAPAAMERRAGRYRAHLLIQATQRQSLQRFLHQWVALLWAQPQNRQVRWSLDVDPQDLY